MPTVPVLRKRSLWALLFVLLVLTPWTFIPSGAAPSSSQALRVLQKTPQGHTDSSTAVLEITVTFNLPMVTLTDNESMGQSCPIRFSPPLTGRCRWRGTNTLVFEPSSPLPADSQFTATVPAGTRSQVSGAKLDRDVSWSFETLRLQLVDSLPRDQEQWIDLDAKVLLQFNLPVDPGQAEGFVDLMETPLEDTPFAKDLMLPTPNPDSQLSRAAVRVPFTLRRCSDPEIKEGQLYPRGSQQNPSPENTLLLEPGRRLQKDRAYYLCMRKGLHSTAGTLGLSADRYVRFETWYTFRLIRTIDNNNCLEKKIIGLVFSNPVFPKELPRYLAISPTPETAPSEIHGSRDNHRREYTVQLNRVYPFQPASSYEIRLSQGLPDSFGNHLPEGTAFTVKTGDLCPSVRMPQGYGVLESYLPHRHPVVGVNFSGSTLKMARVPEEQIIPLFKSLGWARSWEGGSEDGDGAPRRKAASEVLRFQVERRFTPKIRTNVRYKSFFDVDEALGKGGAGLVYTELSGPEAGSPMQAIDNVTGLGLTFKSSPESALLFTTYLRSGSPAFDIPVEIRSSANKVLWSGKTDRQGFADIPGWRDLGIVSWDPYDAPALWAFARHKTGLAVLSNRLQGGVEPWRFNIPFDTAPDPNTYRAFLFTERGIYRPGEKVHLKGVLRKLTKGDWASFDLEQLRLKLTDPRNAEATSTTVTVSARSAFQHSFLIPENAPTGWWYYTISHPSRKNWSVSHSFRVEAYKPAAFEVRLQPLKDDLREGDPFRSRIEGWYLFGAPMSRAEYEWKILFAPSTYSPPGWDEYRFDPERQRRVPQGERIAANGSGNLDEKGLSDAQVKLDAGNIEGPYSIRLEASVTSPDRQKLFSRVVRTVHRSDLYAGVKSEIYLVEKGKPWKAQVICVTPDGQVAAGRELRFIMHRTQWLSAQKTGIAGRLQWVSEKKESVEKEWKGVSQARPLDVVYSPRESGQYSLEVRVADAKGRTSSTSRGFYSAGTGESWWKRDDDDIIELVADKAEYHPGDVARILVKSPYSRSRALVTVEREKILQRYSTILEGGSNFLPVTLTEDCLPNAFVNVVLIQGRAENPKYDDDGLDLAKPQSKFGYLNLPVNPGGRRLKVTVKTDRAEYRPSGKVVATVKTASEDRKPVSGEVSLFAVDEGVLQLTGFKTPDIFNAFYGPRSLWVTTTDSRPWIIGQRNFGEKGEERGGGGGRSGSPFEGIDLRSRFVPTAFYASSVAIPPQGTASVTFTLPDNLSRFRVMAVAHSGKRFGSSDTALTVSKPLLLRPSLPRFARMGDSFNGGVVVHNNSSKKAVVSLEFKVSGDPIAVEGKPTPIPPLTLAPGEAREVLMPYRAGSLGKATFQFKATHNNGGLETDGLEWKIPVLEPEHLETVATSGVVTDEGIEQLRLPDGAVTSVGGVDWTYASSAMCGLKEGARFLLDYPHGCLEQRISAAMPVITGADFLSAYGLGKPETLKPVVQKTLDELGDYQCGNGGFFYWKGDCPLPDPYLTAYVLEAAALARKEGYTCPKTVLDRAIRWMGEYLSSRREWAYPYSEEEEFAARAYTVYALSLWDDRKTNYFTQLYERRDQIPFLAKSYLLLSSPTVMNDPKISTVLAQELLNQSRVSPKTMHFEEPAETRPMYWIHNSTVKTTAQCLAALLETRNGFPGDEKVVAWLTEERKDQGRWRSTHENAAALRAFQDYYRLYEKETPSFLARLGIAMGTSQFQDLWLPARFEGRELKAQMKELAIATVFQTDPLARFRVSKEGTGRLYYTVRMKYLQPEIRTAASEGFTVEKTIRPLEGGGTELKAGKRVLVTLKVTTNQDRTFVAMTDPLPGGFEIVDPSYATEGGAAAVLADGNRRYWGDFQRNEKYDDRIQIYSDFLSQGSHTYQYVAQATTPGKFKIPATWIEQMYQPEVFGRTTTTGVEILK